MDQRMRHAVRQLPIDLPVAASLAVQYRAADNASAKNGLARMPFTDRANTTVREPFGVNRRNCFDVGVIGRRRGP
jgi:hypothetical protein